jgi:Trk K+ transport system NAD-binding subunit
LGLDIISGTILFASMLRDKVIESRFSSYLIETKDLGVLEIEVKNNLVGKKVQELNIAGEFMVVAVKGLEAVVIPQADTLLKPRDTLMAVVKVASLAKIKEKFSL